jgi:hypothetical protein
LCALSMTGTADMIQKAEAAGVPVWKVKVG